MHLKQGLSILCNTLFRYFTGPQLSEMSLSPCESEGYFIVQLHPVVLFHVESFKKDLVILELDSVQYIYQ